MSSIFKQITNNIDQNNIYYFDNDVLLIKGNTEEILRKFPRNCIDLIITSPPYNKSGIGGKLVKKIKYENFNDTLNEEEYQMQQINILNILFEILKKNSSMFYNHKNRYIKGNLISPLYWLSKTKFKIHQEIIWNRFLTGNIRGWRFWETNERIYWLTKGKPKELEPKYAKLTSIWNIRPEIKNKNHPAPFPIDIPYIIIKSILDKKNNNEKIILDPYAGSCTTLLAGKLLGYKVIGIDLFENYLEIGKKRLNNPFEEDLKRIKKLNI